jgi:fermentation-respiration switch protein FrsA (DUF1100 family)
VTRALGILAAVALVSLAGVVAYAWLNQRRMIYFPLGAGAPAVPAALLRGVETVSFETADGVRLAGWFVPPRDGTATATVLVLNGNAGNRGDRVALAAELAGRGLAVLLFDYRGFGGNPGSPSEEGLLDDARAARAWLERRSGVEPDRIAYFGESLGAAVAVALAAERPPLALILRSPFTSLVDVGRVHYPWLPVSLLLADRYPSVERIRAVSCPLLVVAGTADRIVPIEQSRALFDAAPRTMKRFIAIDGAGHNDEELAGGPRLGEAVVAFVARALRAPVEQEEVR